MSEANSFILYESQCRCILKLPVNKRGELLTYLIRYVFDGELVEQEELALNVLFELIRFQIDRDHKKYKDKCEKNRETALKREARKRMVANGQKDTANQKD